MRAMGYYPTEMEITNMMNEVMYDNFEETGETKEAVDLDYFIKLFVNHRPVYGINNEKINEAFKILGGKDGIKKEDLMKILSTEGEKINKEDLESNKFIYNFTRNLGKPCRR
jgi:Ca2+-binding EF-hand superfamily protein